MMMASTTCRRSCATLSMPAAGTSNLSYFSSFNNNNKSAVLGLANSSLKRNKSLHRMLQSSQSSSVLFSLRRGSMRAQAQAQAHAASYSSSASSPLHSSSIKVEEKKNDQKLISTSSSNSSKPRRPPQTRTPARRELIVIRHGETNWNRELLVQGTTDIELNDIGRLQAINTADFFLDTFMEEGRDGGNNNYNYNKNKNTPGDGDESSLLRSSSSTNKKRVSLYSSELSRAADTAQAISDAIWKQWRRPRPHHHPPTVQSSPLRRVKPVVIKMPSLNEWNLGVLEGMTKNEASHKHPDCWNIFKQWANPYVGPITMVETKIQDGESMEDVRKRSVAFLESLVVDIIDSDSDSDSDSGSGSDTENNADEDDEVIIVVTHGGVLGQLLRHVVVAQHDQTITTTTTTTEINMNNNDHDEKAKAKAIDNNNRTKYHRPSNACITKFNIDPKTRKWSISSWADNSHLKDSGVDPIDTNYDK